MMPQDTQPHFDEIGSPDDGRGAGVPQVIFIEPPVWVTTEDDE